MEPVSYGHDGNSLDYAIGRLDYEAEGGSDIVQYQYMGLSTVVVQTFGDGTVLTYEATDSNKLSDGGDEVTGLDRFGRVIDQDYTTNAATAAASNARIQYGYDADGNVLYQNNLVDSAISDLYAYDGLNRLTSYQQGTLSDSNTVVSSPVEGQYYSLDALGNLLSNIGGTNTFNDQNEITGVGSDETNTTYDNNGNTLTDFQHLTYTYDAWNHEVSVSSGDDTEETLSYNADGQRIRQESTYSGSTHTTTFYYDASDQDIEDTYKVVNSGGTVTYSPMTGQYVWGVTYVNDLVLRDDNLTSGDLGITGSGLGERIYVQHDANFDVIALASGSGSVLQRYDYDPYGNNINPFATEGDYNFDGGTYGWDYLFQGGRIDPLTNLYHFGIRDDDAVTGWMEQEPFEADYIDGMNLYGFDDSNPIDQVDPSGLSTRTFPWQESKEGPGPVSHPQPPSTQPSGQQPTRTPLTPSQIDNLFFGGGGFGKSRSMHPIYRDPYANSGPGLDHCNLGMPGGIQPPANTSNSPPLNIGNDIFSKFSRTPPPERPFEQKPGFTSGPPENSDSYQQFVNAVNQYNAEQEAERREEEINLQYLRDLEIYSETLKSEPIP